MRYLALATDFDGTLAHDGAVDAATLDALRRLRASGRKAVLVTGRDLPDLLGVFPDIGAFDKVVAENGATVYDPATKDARDLCRPPPPEFAAELRRRGAPVTAGRVIVATVEPHQDVALEVVRALGLEVQLIFNKGAVMALPSGVNKATGLAAALADLGLSARNAVGVGDAENDHALLAACECGVAVANALPALKGKADLVTDRPRGAGVAELIDRILADDLAAVAPKLGRRRITLGTADGSGDDVGVEPYGGGLMVCGTSGSGKSTLTTGLLERFAAAGYQFAVVDPEGDYETLEFAVALGTAARPPAADEVLDLLADPAGNAVVNLLGLPVADRPGFFAQLLPRLLELRTRTGRPHWVVVDEAHHLFPADWKPAAAGGPPTSAVYITVHPGGVAPAVLAAVDTLVAVGRRPADTVREFCTAANDPPPRIPPAAAVDRLAAGDAVVWRRGTADAVLVRTDPPKTERKRHRRKYAEGNLGPDRSFYFRGPEGKLNLKAHNLMLFVQLAAGVDDDTWEFHRAAGDYSAWFRECVKDPELAAAAVPIENDRALSAADSRAAVRAAVEERYTLPADAPSGVVD